MDQSTLTARDKLKGKWITLILTVLGVLCTLLALPKSVIDMGYIFGYDFYGPYLNINNMSLMNIVGLLFMLVPMLLLIAYAAFLHKTAVGPFVLAAMFVSSAIGALGEAGFQIINWVLYGHMFSLGTLLGILWNGMLLILYLAMAVLMLIHPKATKIGGIVGAAILLLLQVPVLLNALYLLISFAVELEAMNLNILLQPLVPFAWLLFLAGIALIFVLNTFPPAFGKKAACELEVPAESAE